MYLRTVVLLNLALLAACSNSTKSNEESVESSKPASSTEEVTRSLIISGDKECRLELQIGRQDVQTFTPKICDIKLGSDGVASSLMLVFDPKCKPFELNNITADMYFFEAASVDAQFPACKINTILAGQGWKLTN